MYHITSNLASMLNGVKQVSAIEFPQPNKHISDVNETNNGGMYIKPDIPIYINTITFDPTATPSPSPTPSPTPETESTPSPTPFSEPTAPALPDIPTATPVPSLTFPPLPTPDPNITKKIINNTINGTIKPTEVLKPKRHPAANIERILGDNINKKEYVPWRKRVIINTEEDEYIVQI